MNRKSIKCIDKHTINMYNQIEIKKKKEEVSTSHPITFKFWV
mgnify:CR=1 FL=1